VRVLIYATVLFLSAACSVPKLGPGEATRYYVLVDQREDSVEAPHQIKGTLLVLETEAAPFLASRKIIFSDSPSERGYYQYASWTESPNKQITGLLVNRLEESKALSTVTKVSGTTVGDFQLNSELLELYHDISERPGKARVSLRVELVNLKTRKIIAQKKFSAQAKLEEYDAAAAVEGLSHAVSNILHQVQSWLVKHVPK